YRLCAGSPRGRVCLGSLYCTPPACPIPQLIHSNSDIGSGWQTSPARLRVTPRLPTLKFCRPHRGDVRRSRASLAVSHRCVIRIFEIEFRLVDSILAMKVRSASSRELAEGALRA